MNLHRNEFDPPVPPRRRSLVGPVIVITLGVIILLNNLGWLDWGVWSLLARLWPVLFIAAGLDVLFGRRTAWGRWIIAGVLLAVVGGSLAYYPTWSAGEPEATGSEIAEPVRDANRARIELKPGVGELRISALSDRSLLVDGSVWRIPGARLIKSAHNEGDTLVYSLRSEISGFNFWGGGRGRQGRWEIMLNPTVPMDLRLSTGVGTSAVDLTDLVLTDLKIDTGVGETQVTLPGRGQFRAELNTGVGSTTITIPRRMAARIRFSTGIGSADVRGDYVRRGNSWESPNYEGAKDRVEIQVTGGIGEIEVRQAER